MCVCWADIRYNLNRNSQGGRFESEGVVLLFESGPRGFEPWSSHINDFIIDTCHFLTWRSASLGYGEDWLALCQDSVTDGVIGAGSAADY